MIEFSEDFYSSKDREIIEEVLYEEVRKSIMKVLDVDSPEKTAFHKGEAKAFLLVLSIIANPKKEENIWEKILPKKILRTLKKA